MALREEIHALLNNSRKLCMGDERWKELIPKIDEMERRLDEPLRVAVVGIMKAGKSTFMNALLGKDIVYTGEKECTYTVGWFKYGKQPSITICFRDGTTQDAPFEDMEKWTVRDAKEINPRLDEVKYLYIYYPCEILKKLEFIDTPGLNSIYGTDAQNTLDFLAIRGSEDTISEASAADAVVYAFSRSAGSFDKGILDAFQGGRVIASPINSLGILTKVDGSGIWDIFSDNLPTDMGRIVAETTMEKEEIKKILFSITPVCAKVMEGYAKLGEQDFEALEKLSRTGLEDLKDVLSDAAAFGLEEFEELAEPVSGEARTELMRKLGQYGILEIVRQLQEGKTREEIEIILREKSGIEAIYHILLTHFGSRSFLIKSTFVIRQLAAVFQDVSRSSGLVNVAKQVEAEIDRLTSSLHVFRELEILQMYYNNQIAFASKEEEADFLHIMGEYGHQVEEKLGVPAGHTIAELARIAREKVGYWRIQEGSFMKPGSYVAAARVIARSYEIMYYHLSALNEE